MAGWTHERRLRVESAFYKFLDSCWINSKDGGRICLGKNLYWGQILAITEIFNALEAGIHVIYILKSRQLGISTIIRALCAFWLGVHDGLKGALVFDTSPHRESARKELVAMINNLPKNLKFPKAKGTGSGNRDSVEFVNDSTMIFLSAGVKKSKSSGTLGRSEGLALAHMSELCSYDNPEGLKSFEQSLSELHPDRLYIKESTARGFNSWYADWSKAKKDTTHCKCIFLGWWSKPSQQISRDDPDFQLYGLNLPADQEIEKINTVKTQYGYEITPEQLAWVRRKFDPNYNNEEDADDADGEDDSVMLAEQAWCVVAGTRVGTNLGIIPIEEAIFASECSTGKIVAGGPTGQSAVWRVKTALGYELFGTANHPLITEVGPVKLEDSLGRITRLQVPVFAQKEYVSAWQEGAVRCQVPITPDFARFVGLFMGDGSASAAYRHSITDVKICCCGEDPDIADECVRLFESIFLVKATRYAVHGWIDVKTGIHHVFKTLNSLGMLRSDIGKTMRKVHVPEFIWRSPKHIVKEFLSGLFEADGFNGFETNRVAIFSKYPEFIADIQLLLLGFGITSRVRSQKKRAGDGHFYTGNSLELRTAEAVKFNEEIGFLSVRKRSKYDPVAYAEKRKWKRKRLEIEMLDKVVEVCNTGTVQTVWNLTVEGSHLFDANGILTHNTEEEAFQQTGAVFFGAKQLTDQTNKYVKHKAKTYMYLAGDNFVDMRVYAAQNMRSIELKVWEEPENGAQYVMGIDPAFGENENNDRSSIFIGRCYADGIDQVAEYAWPLITTRQFAWVIASLLGWYGNGADINYILELNGPGGAVFNELKSLKFQIDNDRSQRQAVEERGLVNVFKNVKTYIYTRVDAMGIGTNFHWETSTKRKIMILERLRDFVSSGKMHIRSAALIEEMKTVAREGDSIGAPQSMRDDRVISAAMAAYYWDTKIKNNLITQRRTREAEVAKKRASIVDQFALFSRNHLDMFFAQRKATRVVQQRQMVRNAWRYR